MTDRDRIAEFKEVAELMPDDPVVRFGLAGAYLDAGLAEEAVAEYREAVRLKPDYTAAYRGLGRALERAGRLDEARAAYGRGIEEARQTGDLQTGEEIEVFLRRLGPPPWVSGTARPAWGTRGAPGAAERVGARAAAGARRPRRARGGADVAHGAPPDGRAGPGAPAVHARTAGEHVQARALEEARVRAGDGRAPAGALVDQDGGALRADVLLPLGLGGGVAARGRRGGPATLSRAGAGAAA